MVAPCRWLIVGWGLFLNVVCLIYVFIYRRLGGSKPRKSTEATFTAAYPEASWGSPGEGEEQSSTKKGSRLAKGAAAAVDFDGTVTDGESIHDNGTAGLPPRPKKKRTNGMYR